MTASESTKVGHCKRDETDVYIGRGPGGRCLLNTGPLDYGWLGNPYPLDEAESRASSIENFRADFLALLKSDAEFRAEVEKLSGQTLGCWCQGVDESLPRCHGEVIAEWADKLAAGEVDFDAE